MRGGHDRVDTFRARIEPGRQKELSYGASQAPKGRRGRGTTQGPNSSFLHYSGLAHP